MATGDPTEADDLGGYAIHAADGAVGNVDGEDIETGAGYLLVRTGPWIFGRTVLLPASVIERVDHATQTVSVTCTREAIRGAPEYRDDRSHRAELDVWYGKPLGLGGPKG